MSRDNNVNSIITADFDGDNLVIRCDFDNENPVCLPWGDEVLTGYELVIGKEGILMGRLFIIEPSDDAEALLSVSPEFPVMPD